MHNMTNISSKGSDDCERKCTVLDVEDSMQLRPQLSKHSTYVGQIAGSVNSKCL